MDSASRLRPLPIGVRLRAIFKGAALRRPTFERQATWTVRASPEVIDLGVEMLGGLMVRQQPTCLSKAAIVRALQGRSWIASVVLGGEDTASAILMLLLASVAESAPLQRARATASAEEKGVVGARPKREEGRSNPLLHLVKLLTGLAHLMITTLGHPQGKAV